MRLIAAVVLLMNGSVSAAVPAGAVAVVNGEAIPQTEFDAALALRPTAVTPLTAAQTRQIQQEIVQALIEEALLRQFLARHAPPADPAEVERQFQNLVAALKAQDKSLADYCRDSRQTERQLRANLALMLQWSAYTKRAVTEDQLRQFHASAKDFFDKTTVRASHVVIRASDDAERSAAIAKLRELRGAITAGRTTFAEAAQKFSHCPTAPKGGDVGYFARKFMVDEAFAAAAFALPPGAVSEPVVTEFGVHLIQVTDRKVGEPKPFEDVRDEVRDCYAEELRQAVLTAARKSAVIETRFDAAEPKR